MERFGLIKRKVYAHEILVRIEYYPTERGLALQPILDMMAAYSMKYCSKDVFKDAKSREFKDDYGRNIAEIPGKPSTFLDVSTTICYIYRMQIC
jgi:hypothetical protein